MANPDRARKLLIRTALATGSTIATLLGAQNLALLDSALFQPTTLLPAEPAATTITSTLVPAQTTPDLIIQQAAPNFVILRHANPSGNSSAAPVNVQSNTAQTDGRVVFQPPVPNALAAPSPIVVQQPGQTVYVQQPVPQTSKSSR